MNKQNRVSSNKGFTLIELSIVLVIIGLIVGGVLVGQDLIAAAETRAQMSQVEKLNTAVNTFRVKYNAIPGDINNAATFGMQSRNGASGRGDGDGLIEAPESAPVGQCGETILFWRDLSYANLVEGTFTTAIDWDGTDCHSGAMTVASFLPLGKIGGHLAAYSNNSINYVELANVSAIANATGVATTAAVLKNIEAYNIDTKMDDGVPTTGRVFATIATALNTSATDATCRASATAYDIATAAAQQENECNLRFSAQF